MPLYNANSLNTQNDLLMQNLMEFYHEPEHMTKLLSIIHGNVGNKMRGGGATVSSSISLRIIDWFVTNYAKKHYTVYEIAENTYMSRFKVYNDYKLKLKAYSKRRFDPFCRWERIQIPYHLGETQKTTTTTIDHEEEPSLNNGFLETTIGQLNFFKWAIEHHILEYIQSNYLEIEQDMNLRNTTSKHRNTTETSTDSNTSSCTDEKGNGEGDINTTTNVNTNTNSKTRKKREELSISACKCIKKETVRILVKFS
jgi:hypothetical protein